MKKISYRLRKRVRLFHQADNFYLISDTPLITIKINEPLYNLLSHLEQTHPLLPGLEEQHRWIDLADRLVQKGLLVREEFFQDLDYPAISIVIPVKNRAQDIEECLLSLERLDYPRDKIEIIVVDDGSTDATSSKIRLFSVQVIHLSGSLGASQCRNLGAQKVTGELIAFTDSDCVVHSQWLKDLVAYFADERIGIVGGYVSNYYDSSSLDRYEQVKSPLNMGGRPFKTQDSFVSTSYVPSCNLIVRKKAFLHVGGFAEDLCVGEDVDLCWRVEKSGWQILYLPRGEVKHKHRNRLGPMLGRRVDYGMSEAILYRKHKDKKKRIYLPLFHFTFWGLICLAILLQNISPFLLGAGVFFIDFMSKLIKVRKKEIPLGNMKILLSIMRSYFSFGFQISSFLGRYYSIFLFLLALFNPSLWIFLLLIVALPFITDASVRRPRIRFYYFFIFYLMEQLAYQIGVILGCIKEKTLGPLVPAILRKHS